MPALVKVDLVCDVCSMVGPKYAHIGTGGEILMPSTAPYMPDTQWSIGDGYCVCSPTCRERIGEMLQLYPGRPVNPSFQMGNHASHNLLCIGYPQALDCVTKRGINDRSYCVQIARPHTDILPPGWVMPNSVDRYRNNDYYCTKGVCPACAAHPDRPRGLDNPA